MSDRRLLRRAVPLAGFVAGAGCLAMGVPPGIGWALIVASLAGLTHVFDGSRP